MYLHLLTFHPPLNIFHYNRYQLLFVFYVHTTKNGKTREQISEYIVARTREENKENFTFTVELNLAKTGIRRFLSSFVIDTPSHFPAIAVDRENAPNNVKQKASKCTEVYKFDRDDLGLSIIPFSAHFLITLI